MAATHKLTWTYCSAPPYTFPRTAMGTSSAGGYSGVDDDASTDDGDGRGSWMELKAGHQTNPAPCFDAIAATLARAAVPAADTSADADACFVASAIAGSTSAVAGEGGDGGLKPRH
jgi:hypothetical protein